MASQPAHPATVPLHLLTAGRSARVLGVPDSAIDALEAEGLAPGEVLELETRQPFGGPVVVRIGHARLALALPIARLIMVEPLAADAATR